MQSLQVLLRNHRALRRAIRAVRFDFWRKTGSGILVGGLGELRDLDVIARNSSPHTIAEASNGRRVLFVTLRAWNIHAARDIVTAAALRVRGARPSIFTCGGMFEVCDIGNHVHIPPSPCDTCAPYIERLCSALKLPLYSSRTLVDAAEIKQLHREVQTFDIDELQRFRYLDLPLGETSRISLQWFLLRAGIPNNAVTLELYRRFIVFAGAQCLAYLRVIDQLKPDSAYIMNGFFAAEQAMLEINRRRGIPFHTHEGGAVEDSQMFSFGSLDDASEAEQAWAEARRLPLTPDQRARTEAYISARAEAKMDTSIFYPNLNRDVESFYNRHRLDPKKRTAVLFTNVDWDTACFGQNSAFPSMQDWIFATVRHFIGQQNDQLIIRIHPAEHRSIYHRSDKGVLDRLHDEFGELPATIAIVPPQSDLSSYSLMDRCDLGLVYTSTSGMEMVLRGKPVIVGGRCHYSGKGFTLDPETPTQYFELLTTQSLRSPIDPEQRERALQFAYHFFFRSQVPFPPVTSKPGGSIYFNFRRLDDLAPGICPALDEICSGILEGRRIQNPVER